MSCRVGDGHWATAFIATWSCQGVFLGAALLVEELFSLNVSEVT